MRLIYAMIVMEEDSSFIRYGYLSIDNVVVVRKEVLELCSELRLHTLALVSSFGIPNGFFGTYSFQLDRCQCVVFGLKKIQWKFTF